MVVQGGGYRRGLRYRLPLRSTRGVDVALSRQCTATAIPALYAPEGPFISVPNGRVAAIVWPSTSVVDIFTIDAVGASIDLPFMVHVICSPVVTTLPLGGEVPQ